MPQDSEVIVVDDASKVPAAETLLQLADPRIQVLRNKTPLAGGGSPCRNMGASASDSAILFFLDDDDELLANYCSEILNSSEAKRAQFGFSSRKFCSISDTEEPNYTVEKRRLPPGLISTTHRFKQRTFPFSSGFWLTKDAYSKAGPFAETLSTNSDTEYCCRMYDAGLKGFYSEKPGVIVYEQQNGSTGELASVTTRTKSADRAAAFEKIAKRHTRYLATDHSAADFVYTRWVKHASRAGNTSSLSSAISQAPNWRLKMKLRLLARGLKLEKRNNRP
jgi:glycosyltransferase involved in cell wall biosynthesis